MSNAHLKRLPQVRSPDSIDAMKKSSLKLSNPIMENKSTMKTIIRKIVRIVFPFSVKEIRMLVKIWSWYYILTPKRLCLQRFRTEGFHRIFRS